MSYSLQDAQDREAMTAVHEALEVLQEKMTALRKRGFVVELMDEVVKDGKAVRTSIKERYTNVIEGRLVLRVTKAYDLPYG